MAYKGVGHHCNDPLAFSPTWSVTIIIVFFFFFEIIRGISIFGLQFDDRIKRSCVRTVNQTSLEWRKGWSVGHLNS